MTVRLFNFSKVSRTRCPSFELSELQSKANQWLLKLSSRALSVKASSPENSAFTATRLLVGQGLN